MNKKTYISPAMQVVKITTANMIAASPDGNQVYNKEADSGSEGFSRRGSSIWDDDED